MRDVMTSSGYTWPSKYPKPFRHQVVTSNAMVNYQRFFCLNDIGSSKTLAALWAADFLMNIGAVEKVIIVAPLSTLYTVWADEIHSNLFHRKCVVLHGPKAKRVKDLDEDVDFYIINHDGIKVIKDELCYRDDIKLCIVDEGAEFRNARTDKYRALWSFCGPYSDRGLWWLTGSPMPRGPEDVWSQARIISPHLVPKYFTRFRSDLMFQQGMYKWLPLKGWEKRCYGMLQPSVRFSRDECLDLPECTTQTRQVPMAPEQDRAYKEMLKTCMADLDGGKITALNEAARRIKLMQISAGAVYDGNNFTHNLDCRPKLRELMHTIETAGKKVIVFVSFKHSIHLLERFLLQRELSVGVVYGDIGISKRRDVFSSFQHGDLQVILAHPQCMAHGLTLTSSHTVIWWAPVDSYATYEQANGRITRPGQNAKQTIVHLVCNDTEKKIYTRLGKKEKMQGILLELLEEK